MGLGSVRCSVLVVVLLLFRLSCVRSVCDCCVWVFVFVFFCFSCFLLSRIRFCRVDAKQSDIGVSALATRRGTVGSTEAMAFGGETGEKIPGEEAGEPRGDSDSVRIITKTKKDRPAL